MPSTRRQPGAPRRLRLDDCGFQAEFEHLLGCGGREKVHGPRDDAGPAGLMTGAQAGAVVAVEVLVEQDEIAPVRVLLELLRPRKPADGRYCL